VSKDTMTPRERWEAVLRREKPDRVPLGWSATAEAAEKVMAHIGAPDIEALFDHFHIDRIHSASPRYVGPEIPEGRDVYGCGLKRVEYGTGSYNEVVENPLARYNSVEEIEADYTWPDPDWWDYSDIAAEMVGKEDLPIQATGLSPFMWFGYLRGLEQSFIDLVENPDIAHYVLDKLVELEMTTLERTLNETNGKALYSYVADDFGSQVSMLISLAQVREFYIPKVQPAIDMLHDAGAVVIHHNDGAIRPMLPDMIEAGIDVLNPVQWRCTGMEREGLKRDFGDDLVFHAAMDNQQTLAFGSVDDVRAEVVDNLNILGDGGGYILAPCHNIQAVSPPENIVAMYETAYEAGWVR
jgi:uroporphyrinogen decarboxylase